MSFINQWRLSLRLLWREARSGELSLIAVALLLAVTSATAIALFSARLDLAMQQRANDLLGADLRLESTTPLEPHWQQRASELGLNSTQTVHFPSMILAGDEMAMASIKVVEQGYPLKGELTLENIHGGEPIAQSQGPKAGEVWVEPRLVALLNTEIGQWLEVGRIQLRLTGVIAHESDRSAGFYSFSPRLMMNAADLEAADLISTGSRARWRLLVTGDAKALAEFEKIPLADNQQLQSIKTNNEAISGRLTSAQRYLGLAALLAVVLSCVAVAISAKRYAERNYNVSALMRTFGLARKQVFTIYLLQLIQLGVVATSVGLLFAVAVQEVLLWLLADLLPNNLPNAPLSAWLLGASSGLISLLGFALPYLLPLARVSPLKVLRRELEPVPLTGWALSLIAVAALASLLWLFTGDLALTLITLSSTAVVLGIMFVGLKIALGALQKQLQGKPLSLTWRFAWQHLTHNKNQSAGQILAFALTLMIMVLIFSLRTDLLEDWQTDMPADAPNVFAINLQPYELEQFTGSLNQAGIQVEQLHATMPGRLVSINQQPVAELDIAEDNSVNRDLVLTANAELQSNNQLVAGTWHGEQAKLQVSVEEKLAQRLNIKLGDRLGFTLAGEAVEVEITSLRSLDWGALTPNFFMVFSPDVLANRPVTYMTSFHLPATQQQDLTALIRQYPSVTFFDVQGILQQIQTLLEQVTLAIEWILVFVLISAVLVLLASITAGLDERLQEGAIVRTLGASSRALRQAQIAEFALLGLVSSLLALVGAEVIRALLYHYLLQISWSPLGWLWLVLPILAMMLLVIPSVTLLRRTVTVPPLRVLRGLS